MVSESNPENINEPASEDIIELTIGPSSSSGVAQRKLKVTPIAVNKDQYKQKALRALDYAMDGLVNEKKDEFDIFGGFVASELRCIPNLSAARNIKLKLQIDLSKYLLEFNESVVTHSVQLQTNDYCTTILSTHDKQIFNETAGEGPMWQKN